MSLACRHGLLIRWPRDITRPDALLPATSCRTFGLRRTGIPLKPSFDAVFSFALERRHRKVKGSIAAENGPLPAPVHTFALALRSPREESRSRVYALRYYWYALAPRAAAPIAHGSEARDRG